MRACLFLAALALSATSAAAADAPLVLDIPATDRAVRAQLGLLFGHVHYDRRTGLARVEADALARDRLTRLGIDWTVDASSTQAFHALLAESDAGLRSIPGFACYRTVEETVDAIDALVAAHPGLASVIEIGESWRRTQTPDEGYPLRVLRLRNPAIPGTKPVFFAMSSIHAREYTPAELMMRFAEQLIDGYGVDADSTWLLDHNEFHLLIHANPDGRKRAEQQVLWRKNENLDFCPEGNTNPTSNFHAGIDLNRNFPWGWASTPNGSSPLACSAVFRGPGAASEPETQAVRDHVMSVFPDTRPGNSGSLTTPADETTQGLFFDMHSHSGLVLWPWGVNDTPTGNAVAFERLGRRFAWFNGYVPQPSIDLYPTDGTTVDFAYGELGIPAFTFELGVQFFEDCTNFESTILPDNLAALRYAARTLHAPYLLSAGPDAYDVTVDTAHVPAHERVEITAVVDNTRYSEPFGAGAHDEIAGALLFVDQLPWDEEAIGLPMAPTDGAFDSPTETVRVTLDTGSLALGRHLLVVQGYDAVGDYGPPSAQFVTVDINDDLVFADDFEPIERSTIRN